MNEKLYEVIRRVQAEIIEHPNDFLQNEDQTITTLINPILREIGWQTANPREVKRQYNVEGGRVDIALLRNGEPAVFVEAKALNTRLDSKLKQISDYCSHYAVPTALFTDGAEWRVYRPLLTTLHFEQRQLFRIRLGESESDARNAVQQLALLSPKKLEQLEEKTWSLLLEKFWKGIDAKELDKLMKRFISDIRSSFASSLKKRTVEVPLDPVRNFVRQKLSADQNQSEHPQQHTTTPQPTPPITGRAIILDGERFPVKYVYEILTQTAEWLIQRNHISHDECPIKFQKDNVDFIHSQSIHGSDRRYKKLSNGLYINIIWQKSDLVRRTHMLLERYDYPPATLQLIGFDDQSQQMTTKESQAASRKNLQDKHLESSRAVVLAGERFPVKYAKDILIQTAEWLVKKNHIGANECPIRIGKNATRNLIHTEPRHQDREFFSAHYLRNGLILETHGSLTQIKLTARRLLERYDYPDSTLQLIGFDD